MRGKKGSRTEWSVYWRESEHCWVLKYYDRDGVRREARLPRDVVSSPDDETGAQRAGKRWIKAYSSASASEQVAASVEEPTPVQSPLVSQLAEKWLTFRKEKYEAQSISYPALKQDAGMWKHHLLTRIDGLRIDEFGHSRIRKILSEQRKSGYDPVSVRNLWSVLKTFFDDVDAEGWWSIPKNPARHKSVVDDLPAIPKRAKPTLKIEDAEVLLRCPIIAVHRRIRYLLALLSGLRDGEIAGLKFNDILGEESTAISVTKQLRLEHDGFREGRPKTETSYREVPLSGLVLETIQWWFEHGWALHTGKKPELNDLEFPSPEGKPWRPRSSELLRADMHLAGLETQYRGSIGFVFHRTRASFTSWLARKGTPYDLRRHLLGHGAAGVTDGNQLLPAERVV